MHNKIAMVKNIERLFTAFDSLAGRDTWVPGMGLVYGFTGAGKTTAITRLVLQVNGLHVRATATMTPKSLLAALMKEIGREPFGSCSDMVEQIVGYLAESNRPVFVDEADYLLGNIKMIETLRDVHDTAMVPVILIGMEGVERRIVARQQLARRIVQWVQFLPMDIADTKTVASTVCEIEVADDLVAKIYERTKGSIGKTTVALSRIEAYTKQMGWQSIDAAQWGHREMFFTRGPKD